MTLAHHPSTTTGNTQCAQGTEENPMAPSRTQQNENQAAAEAAADPSATAVASTDENGQVNPDGPQGQGVRTATVVRAETYGSGQGYEVGNLAPADTWLDDKGKVVKKQPERGTVLTIKGSPVMPGPARVLEDKKFKG